MDCSPPGPSVHEISRARILEWVAISFSGDLPNPVIKLHLLFLATPLCVCVCVCVCVHARLVAQLYPILCAPVDCSPSDSSAFGDSPGKKIGVGCYFSSRGSSPPRDWIQVSYIAGRFSFYHLSHQGSPLGLWEIISLSTSGILTGSSCMTTDTRL